MNAPSSPALVTGGTGFLGRRLVERLLAQGRDVAVLARRPAPELEARGVRFVRASLDDAAAVQAACAGAGTVFHVAAKVGVWGRSEEYFRTNVLGTRAVIEGCRRHGVPRLVHTSTPSVVYNGGALADADESLPLTGRCPSPYPLSKAAAERDVLAANSPSLRTVALRPPSCGGSAIRTSCPACSRAPGPAASGSSETEGTGSTWCMWKTPWTPTCWRKRRWRPPTPTGGRAAPDGPIS